MTQNGNFHPSKDAEGRSPARKQDNPERKGWQETEGKLGVTCWAMRPCSWAQYWGGKQAAEDVSYIAAQSVGREGLQDGQRRQCQVCASSLDAEGKA